MNLLHETFEKFIQLANQQSLSYVNSEISPDLLEARRQKIREQILRDLIDKPAEQVVLLIRERQQLRRQQVEPIRQQQDIRQHLIKKKLEKRCREIMNNLEQYLSKLFYTSSIQ